MKRSSVIIPVLLIVVVTIVAAQAWIGVGLTHSGYRVKFVPDPRQWGYSESWSDGAQIVNHRRFCEHGRTLGCLYYYESGWY